MAWRTFASRSETKKGMIRVFASLGPNHLMIYALTVNTRSSDRPWTCELDLQPVQEPPLPVRSHLRPPASEIARN